MPLPTSFKLFLISDDEFYRELIGSHLGSLNNIEVASVASVNDLSTDMVPSPDLIILDEHYEDHGIEELLSVMRLRYSEAPLFVLTSDASTAHKTLLVRLGADEVVAKDENVYELLEHAITVSLRSVQLRHEHKALVKRIEKNFILASTPSIQLSGSDSKEQTLEEYTMQIIQHYLARYNNNVVLVANKLGVGKSTIYRYLKDKKLQLSGNPSVRQEQLVAETMLSGNHQVGYSRPSFSAASYTTAFETPVDLSDTESLVDMNFLLRLARGNRPFLVGMMDVFLRSMDKLLHHLRQFQQERDRERSQKYLQKIKPTIDTMGMRTLKGQVVQAERMLDANMDWSTIDTTLAGVYTLYAQCEEAVRQQKKRLQA